MRQYFSIDSALFTIVSIVLIVIGASVPLLILYVLSIMLLISKSGMGKIRPKKKDELGMWGLFFVSMFFGILFALPLFGFWVILAILFLFWCRILYYTISGS